MSRKVLICVTSLIVLCFSTVLQPNDLWAVLNDNFDSYSDGSLDSQGGWSGDSQFEVQGAVIQSGTNAVKCPSSEGEKNIEKSVTQRADGDQVFYFRASSVGPITIVSVFLKEDDTICIAIQLDGQSGNIVYHDEMGGISFKDNWAADTWYKIQVQWRSIDTKVRYRVDDGAWTDWVAPHNVWSSGINKVGLRSNGTGAIAYWDEFESSSPIPTLSEWGVIILMTVMLGIGVVVICRRRMV